MSAEAKSKLKLGYEEYKCFPDDGRRHEIIDGDHYKNPAPNPYHQHLSRRIHFQLYTQIEMTGLGMVIYAPIDVQLSAHDIAQPDLIIVLRERQNIITPTRIEGTPDLVVEILSDSTASNDRLLKKNLYCRSQVSEYWIVDPKRQVIEQYLLRDGEYQLFGTHKALIELTILSGVRVDLDEVW